MTTTKTTANPPNLAAILPTPGAQITLQERPIPTPGPNELLIRNHAIAANPVDWKIQSYPGMFISKYPNVLGSDVCGTVISVGSSIDQKTSSTSTPASSPFAIGDRVTGFSAVIYNNDINHGAWQTYTLLKSISTTKIPDWMSWEEGSVFPMAIATAGLGIFVDLGFPKPPLSHPITKNIENEVLLVWGGSSSVGSMAIQIAKSLGIKVFATASPSNKEYVESLGAVAVFDYRDPDVVAKILEEAKMSGVEINKVFDTISENGSVELSEKVLVGNGNGKGGGELALVLPQGEREMAGGVNVKMLGAYRVGTDQAVFGEWLFNVWLKEALEEKRIVAAPRIRVVEGGVGAAQEVFDVLREGVSAMKLVVRVE